MFKKVNPRQNFPEMERDIMKYWEDGNIFEKSVENREEEKTYSFFDGPPFATGMPHYGHVVASLIKDVVPRFWTMKGKKVERRWGWDCHGLPIENLIEKEHNIKNKQDIERWGVDNFNNACYNSVLRYADDWKKFIPRIGRWVDMENDYRTMDWKYTESIWWVFSELYKKDLVYEGYKAMHICSRCETTLSNFEVTQGYKDITDLSATVKFKLKVGKKISSFEVGKNVYLLAWTTTPWTLPGNVALAVAKSIKYQIISIKNEKDFYVLAKDRIKEVLKDKEFEILNEINGNELVGLEYEPVFNYYYKQENLENWVNGWKIYAGDFISTDEGTGIVHIAPAFGSDDMIMGQKYRLPFVQHVKMNGKFTDEVMDFQEREVKPKRNPRETDEKIVKWLEENKKLFSKENFKHSYPHCWRCDTPLLNYATSSWFVKVTKIKDNMVKNNQHVNWIPGYIKEGRFGKWLSDARDWAVSRNRFWGAPLPIWKCTDCENIEIINSIDKLREVIDEKITKFILLRHGESESNVKNIKAGQVEGYPLTEKGIRQSEEVAKILKEEKIDIMISSPILRAKQTADIINNVLKIERIEDDRIKEYNFGSWNGHSDDEIFCKENKLYQEYKNFEYEKKWNFKFGGNGESRKEIEQRVGKFINEIDEKYKGKNILIIAHGGINAMFNKIIGDLAIKEVFKYEYELDNTGRSIFYLNENKKQFNLHKPNIDKIKINCSACEGKAKIIGDVFDCWFESGSMPYAQWHYPFENQNKFKKSFPAEFIAEGLDQTRGWFYTLMVLSTALFDKPAFKNVIVNGIVLAEDGQKMSKRLNNYPEPELLIEKYGADALRYYLLTSSVMRAENLRFSEKGVDEVLKKFILTLWNTYSFLVMNIDSKSLSTFYQKENNVKNKFSSNLLDLWIISELNILIIEVSKQMESYDLVRASRPLKEFIDKLSNWYVRRSRKRFTSEDVCDRNFAFQTLYYVLIEYSKLLAPFMPFLSEEIYRNLTDADSVHLESYPIPDKNLINKKISDEMNFIRQVVTLGLSIRAKNSVKVRMPLAKLKIENKNIELNNELLELIKEELNVKEVEFVKSLQNSFIQDNENNIELQKDSIAFQDNVTFGVVDDGWVVEEDAGLKVALDLNLTDELKNEGFAREIVRQIQSMRKEMKYNRDDLIFVEYNFSGENKNIERIFEKWKKYIKKECLVSCINFAIKMKEEDFDLVKELKVEKGEVRVGIRKV